MHAAALHLFGGRYPVGVKLIIEGEEETASHLHEYVRTHPERFRRTPSWSPTWAT